jgi:predicted DNA-binding transcriptional regulator AlpA
VSTSKQYILRRALRVRFGNISEMTLWRWERDAKLGLPKPISINGRKYYDISEVEAWEHARRTQTAKHN